MVLIALFSFGTGTRAQQLSIQDLKACLYPTFTVQNAVLMGRGFHWIRTDGTTDNQGRPVQTSIWNTDAFNFRKGELVAILKSKVRQDDGTTRDLVMAKYTVSDSLKAKRFQFRMIDAGYRCVSAAFNGDKACQSWVSQKSDQILMRANQDDTYTFINSCMYYVLQNTRSFLTPAL